MAAKAGADYETELAQKLWDKYKKNCDNIGTTNITYEVLEPEIAGSSSGSDLAGIAKWTIKGKGTHEMNLNIEVKNIKKAGKCTGGLDFGQYTLVYILNKETDEGLWYPNVDGLTWKAIGGKNQKLILATVTALNDLDSTLPKLPPRPSINDLNIWSLATGTKKTKILRHNTRYKRWLYSFFR